MPASRPRRSLRSKLLWLATGVFLGVTLAFVALALPPVQGWLVRYAVRSQMGGEVEFNTVRVGPTGATAQELRLRLPNFAVEARALRLAVSPWQLLTRQRLAIDAVEARELQFTARATNEPATPFTGLLADLQAPLDWAVAQAEAEGKFILEQAGAAPLVATFVVRGREFSADKSAPIDIECAVPGDFVPGWKGQWKFAGQLAYTPGAGGALSGVSLEGTLTPATHTDFTALPLRISFTLKATPAGEDYTVTLAAADNSAPKIDCTLAASFDRASGEIRGDWSFATAPTLVAHFLRRESLPDAAFAGRGKFVERTRDASLEASGEVTFRGEHWGRLTDELAHLGLAEGKNEFRVTRRADRWELSSFDAALTVEGSDARVHFRSLAPQPLVPFRAGDTPWAELTVSGIPLAWAKPFVPAVAIDGGVLSGAWHARTPRDTELTLTPTRPVATGRFSISHPALPATQPLELSLSPVIRLTPETAQLELRDLRFAFERGDFLAIDVASTIDFEKLAAQVELSWQAELPSLLAGPEKPLPFALSGRVVAEADEHRVTVSTARADARIAARSVPVFAAELLQATTYHLADGRIEAAPGVAKIAVNALPLEWLGRFTGYALTGTLNEGEAKIDFDGAQLALRTTLPWTLTGLGVADGSETLLRDATLEITPQIAAPWPLAPTPDIEIKLGVRATLPEVAAIADGAGPLAAEIDLSGGRASDLFRLDAARLKIARANGDLFFQLATERAMTFRPQAPAGGETPLWFTAKLGRLPLELFKGYLSTGQEMAGEIQSADFVAHADWPNLTLKSTAPVVGVLERFTENGVTLLENVHFSAEPGVQNSAIVHAAYVENVRGMPAGAPQLGSLGSGYIMYFGDNYQMPIALTYQTQIDLRQWQQQPIADALSLPATGLITAGYEHDIYNGKRPHFHFALEHVMGVDGKPVAPFKATATLSSDAIAAGRNEVGMHFEVELTTAPRPSKVEFDATMSSADNTVTVNSVLRGDFVDIAEIERLIATTDRRRAESATGEPVNVAKGETAAAPTTSAPEEPRALEYPFWLVLRGRFDLELGEIAREHYRINDVRGALTLNESTFAVTNLSGRTFDGAWGGDLQIDFNKAETTAPYRARGAFRVKDLDAGKIVAAVYPEDAALFSGRLSLDTEVTSQGAHLFGLMNNSAARFDFRAASGRLRVKVPHADLASTALVFGGAVTFSPEIRALGRLIRTFADMPVETLQARGHRDPDGLVSLDEFRVHTPQLRLSATGTWPLKNNADWLTTPFELPVTIEARDEIGVILKGMRLLEKQPGADGFYRLNRMPKLKGTPGQPDTSEIFDLLAHAADKSSGTFGFMMRKLQKEVQKTQAKK